MCGSDRVGLESTQYGKSFDASERWRSTAAAAGGRAGKGGDVGGAIAGDGQRLPQQTLGDRILVRGEGALSSLAPLVRFAVRLGSLRAAESNNANCNCSGYVDRRIDRYDDAALIQLMVGTPCMVDLLDWMSITVSI